MPFSSFPPPAQDPSLETEMLLRYMMWTDRHKNNVCTYMYKIKHKRFTHVSYKCKHKYIQTFTHAYTPCGHVRSAYLELWALVQQVNNSLQNHLNNSSVKEQWILSSPALTRINLTCRQHYMYTVVDVKSCNQRKHINIIHSKTRKRQ